jgi:hypothetical protein
LQKSESQSGEANESSFKMLFRCAAIALSLISTSCHVLAEDLPLGCYVNSYDKAHLAKHKNQIVTSIKIVIEDARKLENSQAIFHAEFDMTLRGQGKTKWGDVGLCNGKAGNWKCQIECDGGNFHLAEDANGLTLLNKEGFRITKDGGCGEETDFVEPKPGNRIFRLSKAKLSACK